jgi:aspartyl-tRNA(Asn)/glutamyl-tRNA(Gln) amidotransferase subunit C
LTRNTGAGIVLYMDIHDLYTTAELARLELSDDDKARLGAEISQILEYFEKMKEIDVDGLEPTTHALLKRNRTREDRENPENSADAILENAPERDESFITIPRIL